MSRRSAIRAMINRALLPLNLQVCSIRSSPSAGAISHSSHNGLESHDSKVSQIQILLHYQLLRSLRLPLPEFEDTGFRVYSQNDEDGLLLHLFSLLGTGNRVLVDVGFGSPHGANTTNLICNWGWTGLLIEGEEDAATQARQFLDQHKDTWIYPPKVIAAWVTAENINDLIQENGISGEIDLFSLDLDGVDYWVWKSLSVVQPRVVLVEYMNMWDSDQSVTVPYRPDFNRFDTHPDYFGASLSAFTRLGREKGYRLVGCNRYGFNAFFVRSDIGEDVFPEIPPERCLQHPQARHGNKRRLPQVIDYEWIRV